MVNIKLQLPDEFFTEEERWGFKITRERKELWAIELDLLCEFDRVCKKLGLRYFLDGGTLLGAVRDGHFIPWDDDIDVVMLREDYDRLLEYGPAEFKHPMFLQNAYTDVDYRRGITQIRRSDTTCILEREIEKHLPFNQGICIDIFPLDGVAPDAELEAHFARKQELRKEIGDLAKKPGHDPKTVQELFRQYEAICSQYRDTKFVGKVLHRRSLDVLPILNREWYSQSVEIEFEGFYFPAPVSYNEFLAAYYGPNYMTPERISTNHGDTIWSTEIPYTEMIESLFQQGKKSI